jgi:Putative metallopeptidase
MQQWDSFSGLPLHEVGHASFDILDVPIFGHEEDAADILPDTSCCNLARDKLTV